MLRFGIQTQQDEQQYKEAALLRNLNRLYECRDLEIKNLWQRSVFLGVFITLSLTAYGFLVSKIFDKDINTHLIHIGAIFLSILGLTLSIVWIMMAKASKTWYEVYEHAIVKFERKYWKRLGMPSYTFKNDAQFRMGNMLLEKGALKNCILSTKAGSYSPSRINILLGQICLLLWCATSVVHTTYVIHEYKKGILSFSQNINGEWVLSFTIASFAIIVIGLIIYAFLHKQSKSSFVEEEFHQDMKPS